MIGLQVIDLFLEYSNPEIFTNKLDYFKTISESCTIPRNSAIIA